MFISGVTSARQFYFFIRSVRAFGTTQSLLFISFTKPSMTTLPSSSSKVKLCFLFEWYSRAQVLILNTILLSHYFILFVSCWSRLRHDKDVQLRKQTYGFAHSWVDKKKSCILPWHLLGHVIMSAICFDLQFSRSTRPMTSFCIFIA